MLVTQWNSLVAESLVTRYKSCSLQKVTRYSLQDLLVSRYRSSFLQISLVTFCKFCSLLVAEITLCKKLFVTPCKIHLLLVEKVARCKICLLLVADVAPCKKLLVARYEENPGINIYLKSRNIGEFYLVILYLLLIKNRKIPYKKN